MKFFKSPSGDVWAFESQDRAEEFLKKTKLALTEMGENEISKHLSNIFTIASKESVEKERLIAYANPVTGSDRYFIEAARMRADGIEGWEEVERLGTARYHEIQIEYPYPD